MINTVECLARIQKTAIDFGAIDHVLNNHILNQTCAKIGRMALFKSKLKIRGGTSIRELDQNAPFKDFTESRGKSYGPITIRDGRILGRLENRLKDTIPQHVGNIIMPKDTSEQITQEWSNCRRHINKVIRCQS